MINGAPEDDESGWSVSAAGDVNNDGIADLIVGSRQYDRAGTESDAVLNVGGNVSNTGGSHVVFGKADGTPVELSEIESNSNTGGFVITGSRAGDNSGSSVSAAGDVNGDGFADVIVGAYNADPNGSSSGASYVVFGKADGTAVHLSEIESSSNAGGFVINGIQGRSGWSVSGAGDVNGDGLADVIVGARLDGTGRSFVVFGKTDGTAVELSEIESGSYAGGFEINYNNGIGNSGLSVSAAGDMNNDGLVPGITDPRSVV